MKDAGGKLSTVVCVRGPFGVRLPDGTDVTPKLRKERALLALLALGPGKCRSRAWLQAILWSEKPPEKAAANLRRALANLKANFASEPETINSNRLEVWLNKEVVVDDRPDLAGKAKLLELIEVPDPAFDDWLRELRAGDHAENTPPRNTTPTAEIGTGSGTIVVISLKEREETDDARFLDLMLMDALSARLQAEGASEIYSGIEPAPERLSNATAIISLELTSAMQGDRWNVHLRALADQERRFLWSGRMCLPLNLADLSDGVEMQAFVSRALTQIMLRFQSFRLSGHSELIALQRAANWIFEFDRGRLEKANEALIGVSAGDCGGVALAWRAFGKLVEKLEFGETGSDAVGEAVGLATEALSLQPGNPLVTAIASRVALDVSGDFDLAEHFSKASLQADDRNPYALQAASRVALNTGDHALAHDLAIKARTAAEGLSHVFAWDMEVCLTALGVEDLEQSKQSVIAAHRNNPRYRAALRYLVALGKLTGDDELLKTATQRLRIFEPDFTPLMLRSERYPALTLRTTGYAEQISD